MMASRQNWSTVAYVVGRFSNSTTARNAACLIAPLVPVKSGGRGECAKFAERSKMINLKMLIEEALADFYTPHFENCNDPDCPFLPTYRDMLSVVKDAETLAQLDKDGMYGPDAYYGEPPVRYP